MDVVPTPVMVIDPVLEFIVATEESLEVYVMVPVLVLLTDRVKSGSP